MSRQPSVNLLVVRRDLGPVYYAFWRDSERRRIGLSPQRKVKLGPAWLEPGDNDLVSRRFRSPHDGWVKRRGQAPAGYLTPESAREMAQERVAEAQREAREREARKHSPAIFDDAAAQWLNYLRSVKGCSPATLRDYQALLASPGAQARKRGKPPVARIMRAFGGRDLRSITTADVSRFLSQLDREPGLGPRTVNKHRQVLLGIFEWAARPDTFGLKDNPVGMTDKRREPPPADLVVYSVDQVHAIARALREGNHRTSREGNSSPEAAAMRSAEDERDAAMVLTAAMSGLRMGELRALRWRDVQWSQSSIHVQRAISAGEIKSTKGRKSRVVPLVDELRRQLDALSRRASFTAPNDLVFPSATGEPLDPRAVLRRYAAAREAAAKEDAEMPTLTFHELRHTFGTLAARYMSLVDVQRAMGHADLKTTQRYLHARAVHEQAAVLSRAFATNVSRSC